MTWRAARTISALAVLLLLAAGCASTGPAGAPEAGRFPAPAAADRHTVPAAGGEAVRIEFAYVAPPVGDARASAEILRLMRDEPDTLLKSLGDAAPSGQQGWVNHYNSGLIHTALGEYGRAEDELRRALELNAPHARAYNALGVLYLSSGDRKKALEFFSNAAMSADAPAARMNLANMLMEDGRMDEAAKHYAGLDALPSPGAVVDYNSAVYHYMAGDYEKALERVERAIKGGRQDAGALLVKAQALLRLRRYHEALGVYRELRVKAPNDPLPYRNMGIINEIYLGDLDAALESYSAYLSMGGPAAGEVGMWVEIVKTRLSMRGGQGR